MKTKSLKAFGGFALVLMVLSIIPSGAFAAEETTVAEDSDIARNGKMVGNMRAAKGMDGMQGMQKMSGNTQMPAGMGLVLLEDLNEENFTDVQAIILEQLDNRIDRLNEMKARCLENDNEDMAKELDAKLVLLESFYKEVEGATSAEALEKIIFDHVKENKLESLEEQIEKLEKMKTELKGSEDEDRATKLEEQLGEQISKLQARYEAISGAEDLDALKEVKFSFAKEERLAMLDRQIARLEEKLENFDENENRFFSEENLEARITELAELKNIVSSAESQEDLNEIRETFSFGGHTEKNFRNDHEGRFGGFIECSVKPLSL
ncbi:MAG: hypothetical protein PHV51_03160 [Methanosarcinaceae archaeon]|nr:hypothetical protein [Methanosarcinaceae archaeon]MDD4497143.1 hypothetical protein [Methanosarcinaceae archaeon]